MTGDQFENRLIQAWSLSETLQVKYDLFKEMVDFFMPKEDKQILWVDVNWVDDTYEMCITKMNILLIIYCRAYGIMGQGVIDAVYLKYLREVLLFDDSDVRFGFSIFIQVPENLVIDTISGKDKVKLN